MGMTFEELKNRWKKGKEAAETLKSASRGDGAAKKLGEKWGKTSVHVRNHKLFFETFDSYETMIAEITKEFGNVEVSWRKVLNRLVRDGHQYADEETFLYIMEFSKSYKFGISKNVSERKKGLPNAIDELEEFIRLINKYSFSNREEATKAEIRCKNALLSMGYVKNDISKEVCEKEVDVIWVVDRCIEAHRTQGKVERDEVNEDGITFEPANE